MTPFLPLLASLGLPPQIAPLLALVAGILILLRPRLLARVVAIYLIVAGILGLIG